MQLWLVTKEKRINIEADAVGGEMNISPGSISVGFRELGQFDSKGQKCSSQDVDNAKVGKLYLKADLL